MLAVVIQYSADFYPLSTLHYSRGLIRALLETNGKDETGHLVQKKKQNIQSLFIVTLLSAPLARAYILNGLLNNSILLLSRAQGRDLEWGGRAFSHSP